MGPFVRMRPATVLEDGSKAGAFVDLKNVTVGQGSKVPHLVLRRGRRDLGEDVNVGAGHGDGQFRRVSRSTGP